MRGLIALAFLSSPWTSALAQETQIIDQFSGIALTFPAKPRVSEEAMLGASGASFRVETRTPNFAAYFLTKIDKSDWDLPLKVLVEVEQVIRKTVGIVGTRREIAFGPCRGYSLQGTNEFGKQSVSRILLIGRSMAVLTVSSNDGKTPDSRPETERFFNSLQLTIDGELPNAPFKPGAMADEMLATVEADIEFNFARSWRNKTGRLIQFSTGVNREYVGFTSNREFIGFACLEFERKYSTEDNSLASLWTAIREVSHLSFIKMTTDRTFRVGPAEGVEFDLEGQEVSFRGRLFGLGNRRYMLLWGAEGSLDEAAIKAYFGSIQFAYRPD